jgi:hypothetical protein
MAINTNNGCRIGIIKDRKQVYNPKTKQYVKLNTKTGKIMSCSDTPYKSIVRISK